MDKKQAAKHEEGSFHEEVTGSIELCEWAFPYFAWLHGLSRKQHKNFWFYSQCSHGERFSGVIHCTHGHKHHTLD
jgi:hypothetical protein